MITVKVAVVEKPHLDLSFTNRVVIDCHKGKINKDCSLIVGRNLNMIKAYNEVSVCHLDGVENSVNVY